MSFLQQIHLEKKMAAKFLLSCKLVLINKQKFTFLCTNVHGKCDTDPTELKFLRDHE